jgi:integrase
VQIRFKHLVEDRDRHGNIRLYVRVPGRPKVRIQATFGTDEFIAAYNEALSGHVTPPRQADQVKPGSFRYLCIRYYTSAVYKSLDISTRNWQRRALDETAREHGAKPVALMAPRHVRRIRDAKSETPAAANQRVKALRAMFNWANEADETSVNPTIGVKKLKYATDGHHSWTPEEIEQFKDRHALGSQARLAFDLLRYTTGRREDAPRLGPQHVTNGRIRFRQAKNEHRNPIVVDIPLHADLTASIAATPTGNLSFLVTRYGKPFTANGFGNKFKEWCRQAGLAHCSSHGLRKATAAALAEAGATPHEIMAITGHQTLEEVERYTKAARRTKLADEAMAKLTG